jgi:hypothetical protein
VCIIGNARDSSPHLHFVMGIVLGCTITMAAAEMVMRWLHLLPTPRANTYTELCFYSIALVLVLLPAAAASSGFDPARWCTDELDYSDYYDQCTDESRRKTSWSDLSMGGLQELSTNHIWRTSSESSTLRAKTTEGMQLDVFSILWEGFSIMEVVLAWTALALVLLPTAAHAASSDLLTDDDGFPTIQGGLKQDGLSHATMEESLRKYYGGESGTAQFAVDFPIAVASLLVLMVDPALPVGYHFPVHGACRMALVLQLLLPTADASSEFGTVGTVGGNIMHGIVYTDEWSGVGDGVLRYAQGRTRGVESAIVDECCTAVAYNVSTHTGHPIQSMLHHVSERAAGVIGAYSDGWSPHDIQVSDLSELPTSTFESAEFLAAFGIVTALPLRSAGHVALAWLTLLPITSAANHGARDAPSGLEPRDRLSLTVLANHRRLPGESKGEHRIRLATAASAPVIQAQLTKLSGNERTKQRLHESGGVLTAGRVLHKRVPARYIAERDPGTTSICHTIRTRDGLDS